MTVVLCEHRRIRGYDCPICLPDRVEREITGLRARAQHAYACIGNGLYVRTAPAKRRKR